MAGIVDAAWLCQDETGDREAARDIRKFTIRPGENGNKAQRSMDAQFRSALDFADRDIEHDAVFAIFAQIAPGIDAADAFAGGGDLRLGGKGGHRGNGECENDGSHFHGAILLLRPGGAFLCRERQS